MAFKFIIFCYEFKKTYLSFMTSKQYHLTLIDINLSFAYFLDIYFVPR